LERIVVWDGWRGLAISFLLIGHFLHTDWIWEERLGVDIFFVLSGMLMSRILFEQRMNLKHFYIRRFSRIWPVLFLFVVTIYAMATLANWEFEVREIFAQLIFIRTYYPADPHIWDGLTPTGHLWSLNVEEHAYVIMSILTVWFLRNKYAATALLTMGMLSIVLCFVRFLDPATTDDLYLIRTEHAISFIFLSAGYNLIKNSLAINPAPITPIITFVVAVLCYLEPLPDWLSFSVSPILLAFTVNHLLISATWFQRFLNMSIMQYLGLWSFSIYIWQQPFYQFGYVIPGGNISSLFLSIILGAMSFYLYENPVRSWINKRWTTKSPTVSYSK